MSATVNCPECNAPLEAPDELPAGKRLQCPDCGAAFAPPRAADRAAGLKAAQGGTESGAAASATATRPRRPRHDEDDDDHDLPRHRSRGGSVALLVGVVVIVFVLLGVGGVIVAGFLTAVGGEQQAVKVATVAPPPAPVAGPGGPGMGGAMGGGGMAPMGPGGPGMAGGMAGPPAQPMPKLGDLAPDIEGADLDGKPMKLSEFKGQVVYLDFWGDWCQHCPPMYAYQNHLVNRMKGKDFVLVGVNNDDTPQAAQTAVRNGKLAWRSWHDGGGQMQAGPIAQRYGVSSYPTSFLIDKNGIVQKVHVGATAEVILDREVDEALAAGENRPPNAPPRWQPGSTAFGQLAEEVAVGPYRVRPPRGYVLEKQPAEAGAETYRWKGPARPDGGVPVFEVSLSPAPAEKDLEALLEKEVEAIPAPRRLGWNCWPAERGDVNGLTFVRAHWSIMAQMQKWTGSGVIYLGLDGDRLIRMSFRELMPTYNGPLDAAPLTLHRAAK